MKTIETPKTYGEVIAINVDVQNDFALPTGLLSVTDGEAVIAPLNKLNAWAAEQEGTVIFTRDDHPLETAHFAINGGIWPIHCVQGTQGAELHKELTVTDGAIVAYKGRSLIDDGYSGLEAEYQTADGQVATIEQLIATRERVAEARKTRLAIIVGGLATDFCDKATALGSLDVTHRDTTDVIVLTDAMRAVDLQPGDGDTAIKAMQEAGAIAMTTEQIINGGIVIDTTRLER